MDKTTLKGETITLVAVAEDCYDGKVKITFDNGEVVEFDKDDYYSRFKPYTQI